MGTGAMVSGRDILLSIQYIRNFLSAFWGVPGVQFDDLLAQWQHGSSSSHLYFLTRHLSQARAARRRLPFLGACCCRVRLLPGEFMVVVVSGDGVEASLMQL